MPHNAIALACSLLLMASPTPVGPQTPRSAARAAPRMKVLFIDSFHPGDPWSESFMRLMREAADELDIDLTIHRASRWPTLALEEVRVVLQGRSRPDYLVMTVAPGYGSRLLQMAEEAEVPYFLVNAGLLPKDRERYGGPASHRYWVGQMLPDDEQAGYELAIRLIDEARARGLVDENGRVQLVAISGTQVDYPSAEREKGLARAIAERDDAVLNQLVWSDWRITEARRKAPLLFRRYPETTVVWAAGDTLAKGAIGGLAAHGREPGEDFLVGAVDWEPFALEEIQRRNMVVSMGGHVFEGAWALVVLHDLHHGKALAPRCLDARTPMVAATAANASEYERLMNPGPQWRGAQFRILSKVSRPGPQTCEFSVTEQLRHLKAP